MTLENNTLQSACEDLVHTLISYYEESLNIDYGDAPEVVIADQGVYKEHFKDYFQDLGINPSENLLVKKANLYMKKPAIYDDKNHRVLLSKPYAEMLELSTDNKAVYVLAHELGHGFQRNYQGSSLSELNKKSFEGKNAGDVQDKFEAKLASFAPMAAIEGQSEYMATKTILEHADLFPEAAKYATKNLNRYTSSQEKYKENVQELIDISSEVDNNSLNGEEIKLLALLTSSLRLMYYKVGFGYVKDRIDKRDSMEKILDTLPQTLDDIMEN